MILSLSNFNECIQGKITVKCNVELLSIAKFQHQRNLEKLDVGTSVIAVLLTDVDIRKTISACS